MRVDGHDISDCFECPMLAGLTEEQKREKIRTDPMIARCLATRRAAEAKTSGAQRAARRRCDLQIDNPQGVESLAD